MTKDEVLSRLEVFNDPEFRFDAEAHVYHRKGIILTGVSSFVSSFKEPFDSNKWAPVTARKRGIPVQDVLDEWKAKADHACDLGSRVHEWIEGFLRGDAVQPVEDEEARARCEAFKRLYDARLHQIEWVAQEVRMFDEELGLAGTFDSLGILKGKVWIGDHKTNGKMTTDLDHHYRMMNTPFDFLKENSLNSYSIQQSAYALMLERAGIEVAGMFLNHIPPEGEAVVLKCKDLRPVLKAYFANKSTA